MPSTPFPKLCVAFSLSFLSLTPATGNGAEIFAPTGDAVEVRRTTFSGGTASAELTRYVIEVRSGTVKYEDAPVGLGEDGATQVDVFHMTVPERHASHPITFVTKAGQGVTMSQVDASEGATVLDDNGFRVTVAEIDGSQITIHLRSESPEKALSHVTFGFDGSLAESGEFRDLPVDDTSATDYDDIIYGINEETGELVRHEMTSGTTETVGPAQTDDGTTLTDIDASAYIPGSQNTFTFWEDPSTETTKMIYVDVETGTAAQVGDSLGPGKVTGATATHPTDDGTTPSVFIVKEVVDSSNPPAALVKVDPETGAIHTVMPLPEQYDSITTRDGETFYGTDGDHIDRIEADSGEIVNIGIFPDRDLDGIDEVSDKLTVFDNVTDTVLPVDRTDRINLGSQDVGMSDVGSIVASEPSTDPHNQPDHYD
jgi:hypothetical protein